MKTERAQELLQHFKNHGISHKPGNGLNLVMEYQDIIGHSSRQAVTEFEDSLDQDGRKNFIWTNFLTLAQDSALDILKITVINRWLEKHAAILEEDYDKRVDDYQRQQNQLNDCKKHIYRRISKLEAENARLRASLEWKVKERDQLLSECQTHARQRARYEDKAHKYDSMKALLA